MYDYNSDDDKLDEGQPNSSLVGPKRKLNSFGPLDLGPLENGIKLLSEAIGEAAGSMGKFSSHLISYFTDKKKRNNYDEAAELTDVLLDMFLKIKRQRRMLEETEDAISRLILKGQMNEYGASVSPDEVITIFVVYAYNEINLQYPMKMKRNAQLGSVLDTYVKIMDVDKPKKFVYPFGHCGERFDINIKDDDTPYSLGMQNKTFILVEEELKLSHVTDPGRDARKFWMDKYDKLEDWDESETCNCRWDMP